MTLTTGATVIDDTYNANPEAMRAAISAALAESPTALVVLGEMRELGADSDRLHHELGQFCRQQGVERFWTTDRRLAQGYGEGGRWFETKADLAEQLQQQTTSAELILVKGSRGAAMETCFEHLIEGVN